jgi:hypothetical protein
MKVRERERTGNEGGGSDESLHFKDLKRKCSCFEGSQAKLTCPSGRGTFAGAGIDQSV